MLVGFNLRDDAQNEATVPYINARVAADFSAALDEINQAVPGGIGFESAFRTKEQQQIEVDRNGKKIGDYNNSSWAYRQIHAPPLPANPVGTSPHEAGFAFDIKLETLEAHPEVEQIFNKHGFGRFVPTDTVHFEWENWGNLSRVEQRDRIQKAAAFYKNCIEGH